MTALLKEISTPTEIKPIINKAISADDVNLLKLNFHIDSLEIKTKKANNAAIKIFDYLESIFDELDKKNSAYKYVNLIHDKLSKKIDAFESGYYKINKLKPSEKINLLLEDHKLTQKDLVDCIGSQGYVSDILKGKRAVSVEIAKKLGIKFGLEPAYFLDL